MDAFLKFLAANPNSVSMVLTDLSRSHKVISCNAHKPRVLASTVKIIVLIAYARRVAAGELDPETKVLISDVSKWYVFGTDGGAHRAALKSMSRNGIDSSSLVSLREVVNMMIHFSSNAATDYLINLLGLDYINKVQDELLEAEHSPVVFLGGATLLLSHALRRFRHPSAAAKFLASLTPQQKSSMSRELIRQFSQSLWKRVIWRVSIWLLGIGGGIKAQAALLPPLFTQSIAADYAQIMEKVMRGDLYDKQTSSIVREHLEWLHEYQPETRKSFKYIGLKGGSLPGVLTVALCAEPRDENNQYALTLFLNGLPTEVYSSVVKHRLFLSSAFRLLADPHFRQRLVPSLDSEPV
jgi:D-alanyl-D-alanine carboxypeptidase